MIIISNKIPINHSFQRLHNSALDDTYICDTIEDAQDYAANNGLAYVGQLLFVKEYRTAENATENSKSALYYVNQNKEIEPVCLMDYTSLVSLLEVLQEANYTKDMSHVFDKLKNELVEHIPSDYNMTIITKEEITNYKYVFDKYGATYVNQERLEDRTYKYTFKVNGNFAVNVSANETNSSMSTPKSKKVVYASIPFMKTPTLESIFSGASSLEFFEFPYLRWSEVTNMYGAFDGCSNLKSLDTSGWDISNVTSLQYTFARCSRLKTLDVSHFNTHNVTNMEYAFMGDYELEEQDVSNWDTSNVNNIGSMFANCYAMKCIDIDNWLTPKLRYMDGVFSGNKGLITVKASNLNTSNVTDMAGLFYKCPELKEVIGIENWVCSKAKYLQYAFEECASLVSLDLSGWNIKEVVNMDKMFADCTSLEEVNLAGWDTTHFKGSGTEWGAAYLFIGCTNLKKVNLSGWTFPESLTIQNVSSMFSGCNSLTRENVITDGCSEHTINLIDEYFNQ